MLAGITAIKVKGKGEWVKFTASGALFHLFTPRIFKTERTIKTRYIRLNDQERATIRAKKQG